jgi:N,N'-diacetyllegionaminate synthase
MVKVFIIAEAGVNHNGDISLAKRLIELSAEAGADAVKFQTFKTEKLVSKFAAKADYQKQTTDASESQLSMLKKLELSYEDHLLLKSHCQKYNIQFLSSPFDLDSVDFLNDLGMEIFKIPSGEITNLPFLRKIAALKKPVILSTGMSNMSDISDAIKVLFDGGLKKDLLTILHCNTEYPTPMMDVNLLAMKTIGKEFDVQVGYSDHTLGVEVPTAAVALGAVCIEKHFTLDKNMPGPDHTASLDPAELKAMVKAIRNIEQALGNSVKEPTPSEIKNREAGRKSLVASRSIRMGEIFTTENLTVKRPGSGVSPMKWDIVLGTAAARDFSEDELIVL